MASLQAVKNVQAKMKSLLGVSLSTAVTKLTRDIIWMFLERVGETRCYVCGKEMSRDTFSIEHKTPWMNSEDPVGNFWNLENISFSHRKCNIPNYVPKKEVVHGTSTGYSHYKCKCELCKEAFSKQQKRNYYRRKAIEQAKREAGLEADTIEHGTVSGYSKKMCRCKLCTEAYNTYYRERYHIRKQKAQQLNSLV